MTLWAIVGLAAEGRLFGGPVAIGGGTAEGARVAVERAIACGATALLSFGFAGGLDPDLPPGALVIARFVRVGDVSCEADPDLVARLGGATQQVVLAGTAIVATVAAKQALWQRTGAAAVDLESGAVAQSGLPFAVLRAVCDPAGRTLPPAAMLPLRDGKVAIGPLIRSIAGRPGQIPSLIRLGQDAAAARRALSKAVRRPGALPPGPPLRAEP